MRLGILWGKGFPQTDFTCSNWSFSLAALTNRKLLVLNASSVWDVLHLLIATKLPVDKGPFVLFFAHKFLQKFHWCDLTLTCYVYYPYSCNMCTVHCMQIPRQPSTFGNCLGYNRPHCITYCIPQCSVLVLTTYFQYDEWNGGRYCCFYFSGLQKIFFLLSRW